MALKIASMKRLWTLTFLGIVIALIGFIVRPPAPRPFDPAFLRLSPLEIARLPLVVRFDQPMGSEHGALIGHLARANPHWKLFERPAESLAAHRFGAGDHAGLPTLG